MNKPIQRDVVDRIYDHPLIEAPIITCACVGCGHEQVIKGQWNKYAGRWLISFNCRDCEEHQEMFVSKDEKTHRLLPIVREDSGRLLREER